jgi:DsbC/DsbD-like thiol-disulfide interchange protein
MMQGQELLLQVFDKDNATDDFLGEAKVLLSECWRARRAAQAARVIIRISGDLLAAPERTQTLPLVIPGNDRAVREILCCEGRIRCYCCLFQARLTVRAGKPAISSTITITAEM